MSTKKLIFLELNEINFDMVNYYLEKGINLTGFKKLIDDGVITTKAESEYNYLEPWIQWPSVHTGKTYNEHGVFRLGDFINHSHEQFFEKVEKAGFKVGAISPMNASNKLKNPAYFIPDPWTATHSDNSFLSKAITQAIVQSVNDNSAARLTFKTIFNLGLAFVILVNPKRYFSMIKYALSAVGKPWQKALFLDILLYEIHKTLFLKKQPNFSTLFLNSGAHIQHHYFFNSPYVESVELQNPDWYINKNKDPLLEMLKVYDYILTDLMNLKNTEIIVATGLSQKPFRYNKFYYRLNDHKIFLDKIGITFKDVIPRMTRDFLISFESDEQAELASNKLAQILVDKKIRLFEEIDNRGKDIFVVLTYSMEIKEDTTISFSDSTLLLKDFVNFVAIKNGEHQSKGFAYFSDGISKYSPSNGSHVCQIHYSVLNFFGIRT